MSGQGCSLCLKLSLKNSEKCDHCNKLVITQKLDISLTKSSKDSVPELSSETSITNLNIQVLQQKQLQWQHLLIAIEERKDLKEILLLPIGRSHLFYTALFFLRFKSAYLKCENTAKASSLSQSGYKVQKFPWGHKKNYAKFAGCFWKELLCTEVCYQRYNPQTPNQETIFKSSTQTAKFLSLG